MPAERPIIATHITPNTHFIPALGSWEIYLKDQGRSPYTVKAFINDLNLFTSYLPADRSLGAVSTKDIENFLLWLQNGRSVPCSPKSLSRRITSVKSFFRWLHRGGVLTIDPAEKVIQQSVISPLPSVLTEDEQAKVLEAAIKMRTAKKPDARPYTLLTLLLATGIKKGECLAINLNHIDLQMPEKPILFVRYASPANRFKERKIELPTEWVGAYQDYLLQYRPADRFFDWSPRRLEYLLEDIGKAAHLSKHLSFDMCRWTCALNDWKSIMDRDLIRQKLGISKIQWREISTKLKQLAESE